jgi:hypothetical protein
VHSAMSGRIIARHLLKKGVSGNLALRSIMYVHDSSFDFGGRQRNR